MSDPVLVEVLRGARVESRHRGAVAVLDADGGVAFAAGDIDQAVFPRSAVKALQALPLLESGAAEALGLEPAEIALACASHSGEPAHVATASAMLARAGREAASLECGAHWPMGEAASRALAAGGGQPGPLHNNCSGKHAGFICLACHLGLDPAGYVRPGHEVMRLVTDALASVCATPLEGTEHGTDGCGIPAYAIPLRALARGFARLGTGLGFGPARAAAASRLRAAVASHPQMVAGSQRFDTRLMAALGARAFVKTGAEGVYCGAFPALGLGFAVKCDDGAGRAAEVVTAGLVDRFLGEGTAPAALREPVLVNWTGTTVGRIRLAGASTIASG